MKKTLLVVLTLSFVLSLAFAKEMQYYPERKSLPSPVGGLSYQPSRTAPAYTFTKLPTSVIVNYYDYMIGSYNGIPLRVIPPSAGGGYFMNYHGRRQATATRRIFYTYLNENGDVVNNNEITSVQNHEGYATIAVDPVSGKPMHAWHADADNESVYYEVQFTSDAFIANIAGLFNDVQIAVDNPISITPPNGTATLDNEFLWPTLQVGPSPVAGKRRVYMVQRNSSATHGTPGPSENPYIIYADFDGDDIETGVPFVWNYTTIPEMDGWNHDSANYRRPFHALTVDNAGNLYYAGYHAAYDADDNTIPEDDLDVFKCDNYGQGTWTRISTNGRFNMWNPPSAPSDTTGYFKDSDHGDIPYGDNGELYFGVFNSSHLNAVVDSENRVHVLGTWSIHNIGGYYYPEMQFMKEFVFDPVNNAFSIRDVYPQQNPDDDFNTTFCPWDAEAPWGVVDEFGGNANDGYYPLMVTDWPFPHWDTTAHGDAMLFHYNNTKISEANDERMMVAVWQNSWRARMYNKYSDPDYATFANTPEIYISVSPNNGELWSEPICLNNIETPELAGIKPMWVYPADKVIYVNTTPGGSKVGKIGFMFYNDYTWGSNAITPSYHPNADGGEVMFMELQITFPPVESTNDPATPAVSNMLLQNYPNPFNPSTTINFDMPAAGHANLSIYNVKGQLVKTLVNDNQPVGRRSFTWNGTDKDNRPVSSCLYFYRLTANGSTETKKMMLIK